MFAVLSAIGTLLLSLWLMIPNSPQIFGKAVHRIKTKEKVVALTYDDGPVPGFTDDILYVLKKHNVNATFFVIGQRAEKNPDLIKKIYTQGHEVGNHSWSHKMLICQSKKYIKRQIDKTDEVLRKFGYKGQIHFRSPHGMKFIVLPRILSKQRRKNILFDVVAWDWTAPGKNKIVKNVLRKVRPGSIILLHDGCGKRYQTVVASDIIIERLKLQGYKFVTISELLSIKNNKKSI